MTSSRPRASRKRYATKSEFRGGPLDGSVVNVSIVVTPTDESVSVEKFKQIGLRMVMSYFDGEALHYYENKLESENGKVTLFVEIDGAEFIDGEDVKPN